MRAARGRGRPSRSSSTASAASVGKRKARTCYDRLPAKKTRQSLPADEARDVEEPPATPEMEALCADSVLYDDEEEMEVCEKVVATTPFVPRKPSRGMIIFNIHAAFLS